MTSQQTAAHSPAEKADPPLLDDSWAARSSDELRALIQHGLMDGDSFQAARELERRAQSGMQQVEHAVQENKVEQQTFARYLLGGLVLIGVLGLVLGLFVI